MTLALGELDAVTRKHMLAALEDDAASGRLAMPALLTREGRKGYVNCLRDAVRDGNEVTLAQSLQNPAWWKKRDGHGSPVVIEQAAAMLATTEFGTLYTAGMCLRLMREGERQCRIYLAGPEQEPRCVGFHLEGAVVNVSDVIMGYRRDDRPALRIPFAPGCCHSICRVDDTVARRCPECGSPLHYSPASQTYSCPVCAHATALEDMLREQGIASGRKGVARGTGAAPPASTLPNSPEDPVLLAICAKGHIVDSMVTRPSAYHDMSCPTCGNPVCVSCPECDCPIRRVPIGAAVYPLSGHARPPHYCTKCAARFPWATRTHRMRSKWSGMQKRLSDNPWIRAHTGAILTAITTIAGIITIATLIHQFWD